MRSWRGGLRLRVVVLAKVVAVTIGVGAGVAVAIVGILEAVAAAVVVDGVVNNLLPAKQHGSKLLPFKPVSTQATSKIPTSSTSIPLRLLRTPAASTLRRRPLLTANQTVALLLREGKTTRIRMMIRVAGLVCLSRWFDGLDDLLGTKKNWWWWKR
jgi:hypothetical protein